MLVDSSPLRLVGRVRNFSILPGNLIGSSARPTYFVVDGTYTVLYVHVEGAGVVYHLNAWFWLIGRRQSNP